MNSPMTEHPTDAMIEAGIEAWQKLLADQAYDYSVVMTSIYLAMEAAKPSTPRKQLADRCNELSGRVADVTRPAPIDDEGLRLLRKLRDLFDDKGYLFCSGDYQIEVIAEVDQALGASNVS